MPYKNLYAYSDLFSAEFFDRVYPAFADQGVFFADQITVGPDDGVLDIGTGSGILAFKSAFHRAPTIAIDTNPRAIALARFGARVNELFDRIQFREESYADLAQDRYTLILCNPPFTAVPEPRAWYWERYGTTGMDGHELFRGILKRMPDLIDLDKGQIKFLINSLGSETHIQALDLIRETFPDSAIVAQHLYIPDSIPLYDYVRRFRRSGNYKSWIRWLRDNGLSRVYRMIVTITHRGPKTTEMIPGKPHYVEYKEIFGYGPKEVVAPYQSGGWEEMLFRYGVREEMSRLMLN